MNDRDKNFDDLHSYLKDIFSGFLPNINTSFLCSTSAVDAKFVAFSGIPEINQKLLENSIFEYNDDYRFIHFTSIENLLNILKSQSFRMYDLNSMEDPQEIIYAKKIFENQSQIDKESLSNLKSQYFALSLCKYNKELIDSKLFMWQLYGRCGKGICIVFKIKNPTKYSNFVIGNIQYKGLEKLKNIVKKHKEYVDNKQTHLNQLSEFMSFILSLYKAPIYSIEKEVRLLYFSKKENGIFKNKSRKIFPDIKNNKNVFYKEVNMLKGSQEKQLSTFEKYKYSKVPKFKIEEIILGYDVKNDLDTWDTIEKLSEVCLGYVPKIRITKLKEFF